ncbi:MAG TPA: OsmC family peroxiredoxin [Ktedonobacterales bacterium]
MPTADRQAQATWEGNLFEGHGSVSLSSSGAVADLPVSWVARTEQPGGKTSPEELIAAAQAACYAMAFSNTLNKDGKPAERLTVNATCSFTFGDGPARVSSMRIDVTGRVPGLDAAAFEDAAKRAEQGCPVANAIRGNVPIEVSAHLES